GSGRIATALPSSTRVVFASEKPHATVSGRKPNERQAAPARRVVPGPKHLHARRTAAAARRRKLLRQRPLGGERVAERSEYRDGCPGAHDCRADVCAVPHPRLVERTAA